jgi:hypothetical protein
VADIAPPYISSANCKYFSAGASPARSPIRPKEQLGNRFLPSTNCEARPEASAQRGESRSRSAQIWTYARFS